MKTGFYLSLLLLLLASCRNPSKQAGADKPEEAGVATYANPIFSEASDVSAIYYHGKYYFTCETVQNITLWETPDITDLSHAVKKVVWKPGEGMKLHHLWDPEICRIDGKWYIYFAADDGNTDNHQLYAIENDAPTPMEGTFRLKGPIITNREWNWGIHPAVFTHKGALYLLWSGWRSRRINAETQCIYLARMKNPWTLDSGRVMLSWPEYEWERQWINPDGSRTAYAIYVNEAPQFLYSKNRRKLIVYYSASGCWTPYYSIGRLTADADADLLDAASWEKSDTPVFGQNAENQVYGPGGFSFVSSPDSTEVYVLYHARNVPNSVTGGPDDRTVRMQKVEWDADGMPLLGEPVPLGEPLPKPSGTGGTE